MKYDITYACGHTGTIELFGVTKDRESKIEYLERNGECPACRTARLQREQEQAIAEAKAQELPVLQGSEKQVVWASELRREFIHMTSNFIAQLEKNLENVPEDRIKEAKAITQDTYEARDYILKTRTSAHGWIECRYQNYKSQLSKVILALRETAATKPQRDEATQEAAQKKAAEAAEKAATEAAAVVTPDHQTHDGVVKITLDGNTISAKYPRDDAFRTVVKSLYYQWDRDARAWERVIDKFAGSIEDRIVELGNRLLTAGFAVSIMDAELRRRAVAAEYVPECRRWVALCVGGEYAGWLSIRWSREDNLFARIKAIHGARWNHGTMAVPVESYDEVLDMADMLGFRITDAAQEAIDTYRSHLAPPITPAAPEPEEQVDKLAEILESSREVISDLTDN